MNDASRAIQRVYLLLLLLHTLAASLVWGINTLFLLDAGLSNGEAFGANACFTAGMVLFEVPTGVVADTRGRRTSYLLGTLTLTISTLLYLVMWQISAPFWAWGVASVLLGLGFTFFSGAVEAWLVDALRSSGYTGELDPVFARGEIVEGIAMLGGSVAGGAIAQATDLGVPYVLRAAVLAIAFGCAFVMMRDVGFTPRAGDHPLREVRRVLVSSIRDGFGAPPVRWIMLAAPFTSGVSFYAFYAMQPYLLELWGDPHAFGIAGLAAAIVAGAQIAGGFAVPLLGRSFRRRTSVLLIGTLVSTLVLVAIGFVQSFAAVLVLLVLWALVFAVMTPIRQAYLNGLVEPERRATLLSLDSLLGSSGGIVIQPALGRAADVWSYPTSYAIGAAIQALALPFVWLARRERAVSDPMANEGAPR
ncbi:MFS transporter [Sandaracinus amylolyticus]|uniref:MFS transporter n=1 Tax=Sandaracinus amylolyticus TaxID=927083 RepID=UPI001F1B4954|nr:MFS transporter [Sandaracinus amylolyticus]